MSISQQMPEEEENRAWKTYKQTKDPKIREMFIIQYSPLVKYVAGKICPNLKNVEFNDLVGYGAFGLLDAIEKFDPDKKNKFKTYAVRRIQGAILDELRSTDSVSRSYRQKFKAIEEASSSIEAKLGRAATDKEIADAMGISDVDLQKYIQQMSCASVLSLNDMWNSNSEDSDSVPIIDSIEGSTASNPDDVLLKKEMSRIINDHIHELPEKEKKVIMLYYYEDLTLKEIGAVLEVTESRVSQLHTKAQERLRLKLSNLRKGIV